MSAGRPIIANVDRLHAVMDRERLAAVVARAGHNFTYLSGMAYPGTLARHVDLADTTRAVLLVWPRHGEPVVVLNKIAEALTLRDSWVKRAVVYDAYNESPYAKLCDVLREAGLAGERIGIERTYVSAAYWDEVQGGLPQAHLVDSTALMDEVRSVKTPGEIALLRRAADLLDDAYAEVFPTIRPGETERAVHSRLIASCIRRGANWAHGILNSGRNTIPYAGESDETFERGDVVRTDYVAYVDGYPGHQSRNAVMGAPDARLAADYAKYADAYRKILDRCRAGVRAGDVYDFTVTEFRRLGWEYHSSLAGHSVGPWWHQQEPIIARGRQTVLEDGMVLAMEPHGAAGVEALHLQDMIVIRRGSPELISSKFSTDALYVIG
jgi:Xaa-Pro aminopeptidase